MLCVIIITIIVIIIIIIIIIIITITIGNEIMHQLATDGFKVLRVEMMDYNGQMYFAQYTNLQIDSETDNYKIHLHDGEYSGNFCNCWKYFHF